MNGTRNHKDLVVWQKARKLVSRVYHSTASFPRTEQLGLALQSRRAGISILSNVSEGAARGTDKEFLHFLLIARGSLAELEAQLLVASDLGFVRADDTLHDEIAAVGKLINGLIKAVREDIGSTPKASARSASG